MTKIRPAASVAVLAAAVASPVLAGPPAVPTFTDETVTRLVAPPDTGEKDYGVGDLDGDGDLDVVVARRVGINFNQGTPLPNLLLMNEDGVLVDRTAKYAPDLTVPKRSRDALLVDVDQDGWLDVMIADGPDDPPLLLRNLGEAAAAGAPGGWLGLASAPMPAGFTVDAWTLAAADVIGDDGFPEVFVGAYAGDDRFLVNNGDGTFTDGSANLGDNASTSGVRSSAFVDLNGDGDLDLVEGVTGSGVVRMLPNDGSGSFARPAQNLITGAAYNFGLGHLDGDGSLDIFGVRNGFDEARLNLGAAGETVTLGSAISVPNSNGFGAICRTADLDGDGDDDFLVADLDQEFPQDCSRRLMIYLNSGAPPWFVDAYPVAQAWTPNGTSDIALLDLDGDGDLDMLIGHCAGHTVFMQDGSPDPPGPLGDLTGDGIVDVQDLIALLLEWGACPPGPCAADLDANGVVNVLDLVQLMLNWG